MSICFNFLRKLRRNTAGTVLVEMAILVPLLLLLIFGILEYGRLYWITGAAQKATAIASRIAAVRQPICPGVPTRNLPVLVNSGDPIPKFGTLCRAGGVCAIPDEIVSCFLDDAITAGSVRERATGTEIWGRISALMPPGSTAANVKFLYSFDERLGFLGGPYSPMVTAELIDLEFRFVSPLGRLAALAASDASLEGSHPNSIALSSMSASMPGEDLATGTTN